MNIPTTILQAILFGANPSDDTIQKQIDMSNISYFICSSGTPAIVKNIGIVGGLNAYKKFEDKIKSFNSMKIEDIDLPSVTSISYGLEVLSSFKDLGIKPYLVAPMSDGGITFEFFTPYYNAIEIYNDGEIVHLKRPDGDKDMIQSLKIETVKDSIRASNSYGDR